MQVMLIFILIDVQHLQKINLSFEKGSNSQNHSSSDSHQKPQPPPPATKKIFPSPHPLNAIWKTMYSQPKWLQKITFSNNCVTKKKNSGYSPAPYKHLGIKARPWQSEIQTRIFQFATQNLTDIHHSPFKLEPVPLILLYTFDVIAMWNHSESHSF